MTVERNLIREVYMNLLVKGLLVVTAVAGFATAAAPSVGATNNSSTCVDGSARGNLTVAWNSNGNVTVGTKGDKPLCNDVNVFFSSYTMPDNYNGQPFTNNPTASPQAIFDNASVVMKKGENKNVTLKINLPASCKNTQVDVYYAPKIETVTSKGHGNQYISGKIISKTQNECTPETPPTTPEVPTPEAETPETPAPEVTIPETVTEMPKTGIEASATAVVGTVLSAATYAGLYIRNKRR